MATEIVGAATNEGGEIVVPDGLEGVVVTRTSLSDVDGERGRLIIAGHDVEALAGHVSFEDACTLLWGGALPDPAGAERARQALAEGRARAFQELRRVRPALETPDAMDALRGAVGMLPGAFAEPHLVTGALAVFAAAHARIAAGLAPVPPDARASHAADMLRMLGLQDDVPRARGLDAYLVTVVDHGLNASTFAARVVASTGSDLLSAVVAALGALKGPLHGGAPGPVLDMLDAVGAPERAEAWLEGELAAKRRIMGMGHRVYRVRDPRAAVLEVATQALERAGVSTGRLALARAVEKAARGVLAARHPSRPLHANVEFYTAVLLDTLGIPRTHFTATFAAARAAGWCAHVAEQRRTGRLLRPSSLYVGPRP